MTYDPSLPTTRDKIRFHATDIDETNELMPDATYDTVIASYTSWKRAAADLIDAAADLIARKVTSLTSVGDASLSWSRNTAGLKAKAARFRQEADDEDDSADDYPSVVTISQEFLTGYPVGGNEW